MKTIIVEREHDLGQEDCQALAEELVTKWVKRIGGRKSIDDNVVSFKHINGTKGEMIIEEDFISIEIKLGMLVRSLGSVIESEINRTCDKYIGEIE